MNINKGKKLSNFVRFFACLLSFLLALAAWDICSGLLAGSITFRMEGDVMVFMGAGKLTKIPLNLITLAKSLFGMYFTYILVFVAITGCQPKRTIFNYGIRKV